MIAHSRAELGAEKGQRKGRFFRLTMRDRVERAEDSHSFMNFHIYIFSPANFPRNRKDLPFLPYAFIHAVLQRDFSALVLP